METKIESGIVVAQELWEERKLGTCPVCNSPLEYYFNVIENEEKEFYHVAIRCKRERGICFFNYANFVEGDETGPSNAWKQVIGTWIDWKVAKIEGEQNDIGWIL